MSAKLKKLLRLVVTSYYIVSLRHAYMMGYITEDEYEREKERGT